MTVTLLKSTFTRRNYPTHINETQICSRWSPVTWLPGTQRMLPSSVGWTQIQLQTGYGFYLRCALSLVSWSLILGETSCSVGKGPCGMARIPRSSSPRGPESCQQPCEWELVPPGEPADEVRSSVSWPSHDWPGTRGTCLTCFQIPPSRKTHLE